MESPESGLAVYIKELMPNGGKVDLSSPSKVPTEGWIPGEEGQNQRGLALEDFSNLPGGNQRIPAEKGRRKMKDRILLFLMVA